jgi:hypothetical protein
MSGKGPGRIGPWRMLDFVMATMPFRVGMMSGAAIMPEFGPADAAGRASDPDEELPGSNISLHEQNTAIARERTRRWLEARSR